MLPVEAKAMDIVNELLENEELPMDRVKSIDLNWEAIDGTFFPVLHCEFYENKSLWTGTFGDNK